MATGVAFKQKALFRAVPGLFSQRSLFSNSTPFDDMSVEIQTLNAIVKSYNGSLYLPNVSNFENTTVATGIDDAAELDDPIAYAGDLTTANLPENMLINSVFAGAVVGAPGTMPTGWSKTASGSGLTTEIVAASASSITVKVSGTANATTPVTLAYRSNSVETAAKPGEMWSIQLGCSTVVNSGSSPAGKISISTAERTAAASYLSGGSVALTTGLNVYTRVLSSATTERYSGVVILTPVSGETYDFTVTISNIQLERGRARTYVPTYGTALSRGTFNPAFQPTLTNKPFLRSKDYSRAQWASATSELWSITNTAIADTAGVKWGDGEAYLNCPGVAGNYASTPDSAAASLLGDQTYIFELTLSDWTPDVLRYFLGKYGAAGQRSLYAFIPAANKISFSTSEDGTNFINHTATVTNGAAGLVDGSKYFIKITLDVDNGASGHDVIFSYSSDYNKEAKTGTWEKIGNTITTAGVTSVFDSTAVVTVGSLNATDATPLLGKIYYFAAYANLTGEGTPAYEFYPARDCIRPSASAFDFDNINDYLQTPINPTSSGYMCVAARQDEAISTWNSLMGALKTTATVQAGFGLYVKDTGAIQGTRGNSAGAQSSAITSTLVTAGIPFIADTEWSIANVKVRLNGSGETTTTANYDVANTGTVMVIGASNQGSNASISLAAAFGGAIFGAVHIPSVPSAADQSTIRKLMGQIAGVSGVV